MILHETILRSADNAGARFLKCINVRGGGKRSCAYLGDFVTISIKNLRHRKKLEKKKIYNGLIIAVKKKTRRTDGTFVKFDRNRVLVFGEQKKFLGTRIYGPVCREIRQTVSDNRYKSIFSLIKGNI